jgi:hypothetical protein
LEAQERVDDGHRRTRFGCGACTQAMSSS